MHWLSIEVFDAAGSPASAWQQSWHDALVATAVGCNVVFWDEHEHRWGVVLELCFAEEADRDRFRQHSVLAAAIDAAPDVFVYPHRGGGAGAREPRRPRPVLDSGAVRLPEPESESVLPLAGVTG